jgi:hypothetical protein
VHHVDKDKDLFQLLFLVFPAPQALFEPRPFPEELLGLFLVFPEVFFPYDLIVFVDLSRDGIRVKDNL